MPLSLLLQLLNDSGTQPVQTDLRALYTTADALTLRRLALLSTVERWENNKLQLELLEEVIRRDDPKELGIFLASSHLTKQLSNSGALGHALATAAEKGLVHVTSILACRSSVSERSLAALRAAELGNCATFECLLRSCKSDTEEQSILRSSVCPASSNGHMQLLRNIVAGLHCFRIRRIGSPAALYCTASRGAIAALEVLLRDFQWSQIEIVHAKGICDRNGFLFPTIEPNVADSAINGNSKLLIQLASDGDALGPLSVTTYSREALLSATRAGSAPAVTALLALDPESVVEDLPAAINVACENGHYQVFSRLYQKLREKTNDAALCKRILSQGLICASRNDRAALVQQLITKADEQSIQRAYVYASGLGNSQTLRALLRTSRLRTEAELKEILVAGLVEGRTACVTLLREAHPQQEILIEELARLGVVRAARLGDPKLADASAHLLTSDNAGGMATAAVLMAKKHGFEDVVLALKPLKRGISQFPSAPLILTELNDDVFDRVLSFLDLRSVSRCSLVCSRFARRGRISDQITRVLIADYSALRLKASGSTATSTELLRLARILSSSKLQPRAFEMESKCKAKALEFIIENAVREDWPDVVGVCSELCLSAADADVAAVVEMLMNTKLENGQFVISPAVCQRMFQATVSKECLRALMVICRIGIPSRRLGTRQLVEKVREEASAGNATTMSLLVASLSREALTSRRERDALWARRRLEWERRGGIWGAVQLEEEQRQGRTDAERDFDDAIGGALRRSGSNGHTAILRSLLKMLRARGRLTDFAADHEKAFEGACRAGFEQTVSELYSFVTLPEPIVLEGLATAARNGQTALAKVLVMDGRLPLSVIRSKFMESARRGHSSAIQTFLATGAIGASVCADALEETIRREHEDCTTILQQAHERLVRFEEEEGRLT